jgi:hypothetical protein
MSWTAVFPVLTEAQVAEYESHATPAERAEVAAWTEVARVINPQPGKHLIATSLFWKPAHAAENDFPRPTREVLRDAAKLGLVSRHAPWEHYVQPLLDGARTLRKARPDVVFSHDQRLPIRRGGRLSGGPPDAGDALAHAERGKAVRPGPAGVWNGLAELWV